MPEPSELDQFDLRTADGRPALVTLADIRLVLGRHGLHLVSEADKRVLDAGNLVLDSSLRRIADENGGCLADWAKAELARRGEKGGHR